MTHIKIIWFYKNIFFDNSILYLLENIKKDLRRVVTTQKIPVSILQKDHTKVSSFCNKVVR